MGRSWQFLAVVATICAVGAVLYYSSDFYAERAAGGPAAEEQVPTEASETFDTNAPAEPAGGEGIIPTNE